MVIFKALYRMNFAHDNVRTAYLRAELGVLGGGWREAGVAPRPPSSSSSTGVHRGLSHYSLQRGNCFPHLQQDATIASSAAPPTLGWRSYFDGAWYYLS